jgi:hypothetical protein
MSDRTLEYWRGCRIGKFGKMVDDLDDEEIEELASNLTNYIFGVSRDKGICIAGGDPKAHEPYPASSTSEGASVAPKRNINETG